MYDVSDEGGFNLIFEEKLLLYWRGTVCKKDCSCRARVFFYFFYLEKMAFLGLFYEG